MRIRWFAILIIPPLLVTAGLYTHPLWSSASLPAADAQRIFQPITRITREPAAFMETGLALDDLIDSMAFDPDGVLWLSSIEGGVYMYSIPTNEVVHLLISEYVYGLFAETRGVWVLTSRAAYLYRNQMRIRTVLMPPGVVAITGAEKGGDVYFGTSSGFYFATQYDIEAQPLNFRKRIRQLKPDQEGFYLATDDGLYQWSSGKTVPIDPAGSREPTVSLSRKGALKIAATQRSGLILFQPGKRKTVLFAKPELNAYTPGVSLENANELWFGTSTGFLVGYASNRWTAYRAGNGPVTAIVKNKNALFVWCGGKLLQVLKSEIE